MGAQRITPALLLDLWAANDGSEQGKPDFTACFEFPGEVLAACYAESLREAAPRKFASRGFWADEVE